MPLFDLLSACAHARVYARWHWHRHPCGVMATSLQIEPQRFAVEDTAAIRASLQENGYVSDRFLYTSIFSV